MIEDFLRVTQSSRLSSIFIMNFPRLHPDTIEEVKEKIDIYEIISDYVILKKRGQNYVDLCPFHQEKKTVLPLIKLNNFITVLAVQKGEMALNF